MDDNALVDRVRAGDRLAERELYDAHVDRGQTDDPRALELFEEVLTRGG